VKTEVTAGVTTFMTMAYIVFVNPAILKGAGIPPEGSVVATCVVAGTMTLLMGLWARYPFAIAPGMGINAIVVYTMVQGMKLPWEVAMGAIVAEGLLATLLVVSRLREVIMDAIPMPLKHAIGVGIGLFISLIGLVEGGMITANPATIIGIGPLSEPYVWVTLGGLLITSVLVVLQVRGGILLGILATAGLALPMGVLPLPEQVVSLPTDFSTFFRFDLIGALQPALFPLIFGLFMTDFFDTMGTVIGVSEEAGFLDSAGRLPRLRRVLLIDSLSAVAGGMVGSSSATTYIESAAGVSEGGRTGLASVVTGGLFFLALFFTPLVSVVAGGYPVGEGEVRHPVTAPALIIVGFLILRVVTKIDFTRYDEAIPAFLIILLIPLTYSISTGIGIGFIAYVLIKLISGRGREVHPLLYAVAALFVVGFFLSSP
jgi:AGZA family xanthine/uracil permease-like MFS transporter